MKPIILSIISIGGLCNRMRTMASVIDLARQKKLKPVFIWIRMSDMNASFRDLFTDFPFKVFEINPRRSLFRLLEFLKNHWRGIVINDAMARSMRNGLIPPPDKNILVWICESITNTRDFSMFKVTSEITSLSKFTPDRHTIGVHIRRTDNEESRKHSPTSLFVKTMQKEILADDKCKFFLATDDIAEENELITHFGSRIITYHKRSLSRNAQEGIEDALVDLYLLSRCRKIIASYYSSYSDVAALWGGIEKEVQFNKL